MTVFIHELKQNKISLIIWSAILAFILSISVLIFPEMSPQMNDMNDMLAEMGAFSEAFGMDELNFGEFTGYFGLECGNSLGLGSAFFAAMLGASILAKEERERTAEFLLTHPISRAKIVSQKLLAVVTQIFLLNALVVLATTTCIFIIGETEDMKSIALIFLAYLLLQLEIACVTFGVSAFIKRGGIGIGLGLAAVLYFMNILANLTEELDFLSYLSPFGYTEGSDIISNGAISAPRLAIGVAFAALGIAIAFWRYTKKDIT